MPTHSEEERFWHDWHRLTEEQQDAFLAAVENVVGDIKSGQGLRQGPRVKGVRRRKGVFEMTWADDGRATFHYGLSPRQGATHIVWRRIGDHEILKNP